MRPNFDDPAIRHADDAVAAAYSSQAVGDDDDGAALDDAAHVALNDPLAVVIERRGRLVENENARIGRQRPGDGDALTLATGEIGAALLDHRVIALRQLVDELLGAGEAGDLDHPRPRHRRIGESDVLVNGAVEQQVLLQHDADVAPEPPRIDMAEIRAVEQHLALARQIKTLDELGQGRFAGAGGADDADRLAGPDGERNLLQRFRRARPVAEADAAEFDRAARRRRQKTRRGRGFGACVEDVAQAFDRDLHLLEILPDLRQPQDRLDRLRGDHVEGDESADGELAVDDRLGAEQKQRRGGQLADILDRELPARAQHRGGKARLDVSRKLLLPLRAHDRLDRRRFDRVDADDRLDQELLARRAAIEFLADELA